MTTGMPLVVTVGMKPIATLTTPLETVNLDTLEVAKASKERRIRAPFLPPRWSLNRKSPSSSPTRTCANSDPTT